jgi:hypothetical protein
VRPRLGWRGLRHSLLCLTLHQVAVANLARVTRSQMEMLLDEALQRYRRAHVEPGEAVGAVGAQSISEPATQVWNAWGGVGWDGVG